MFCNSWIYYYLIKAHRETQNNAQIFIISLVQSILQGCMRRGYADTKKYKDIQEGACGPPREYVNLESFPVQSLSRLRLSDTRDRGECVSLRRRWVYLYGLRARRLVVDRTRRRGGMHHWGTLMTAMTRVVGTHVGHWRRERSRLRVPVFNRRAIGGRWISVFRVRRLTHVMIGRPNFTIGCEISGR
jgi:hypothetical protein